MGMDESNRHAVDRLSDVRTQLKELEQEEAGLRAYLLHHPDDHRAADRLRAAETNGGTMMKDLPPPYAVIYTLLEYINECGLKHGPIDDTSSSTLLKCRLGSTS
jgi:hypothetical protein